MDHYFEDSQEGRGIQVENNELDDGMDDYFLDLNDADNEFVIQEGNMSEEDRSVPSTSSGLRKCAYCKVQVDARKWNYHLHTNVHKMNASEVVKRNVKHIKESYQKRVASYMYENDDEGLLNVNAFLEKAKTELMNILLETLKLHIAIKFNIEFFGEFQKKDENKDIVVSIKSFQTKMQEVLQSSSAEHIYDSMVENIVNQTGEFQERDSGWSLSRILHVELNINKYQPFRGSSFLELPKSINDKKACINVHNDDIYCFKWAIISALSSNIVRNHPERTSVYRVGNIAAETLSIRGTNKEIRFDGLQFPLKIQDVGKFEVMNPDISVNVFGLEPTSNNQFGVIGPYYSSKEEKAIHINLLLVQDKSCSISHYVWIKSLAKLINSQVTRRNGRIFICNFCLQYFYDQTAYDLHKTECNKITSKLPSPDKSILKFKNFKNKLQIPFVVYADFECILKDIPACQPNPAQPSVTNVQEHIPCSVSYFIKSSFDSSLNKLYTFYGTNCVNEFLDSLIKNTKHLYYTILKQEKKCLRLSTEEQEQYENSSICHICKENLDLRDKVLDHCHLTGLYRGPAHRACNLAYSLPNMFPIFFHNFTGYDSHLLIKNLNNFPGEINVIPLNKEKYISLSKRIPVEQNRSIELRFLDSIRFMPSSLEELASNLSSNDFQIVKSFYTNDESFKLMTRKGIYPYDYIDSWERLKENSLPPRQAFQNKLTGRECTEEDYFLANKIWKHFDCKTLKDYMLLYLKSDVLILADVFENFRNICTKIYELDPCQYFTAPGLSWDAMLKLTKVKLQLLTDINMFNFIKKGIRGGLTQCCHRHAVANNKYMTNYDPLKESKYLMYLDANNLYGWAMSQFLPCSDFVWEENFEGIDFLKIPVDSETGYILEVDIEYPKEIHDIHNDLPFCPVNKLTPLSKTEKLIASLETKHKYIIHYRTLQQCIKNGVKCSKIHRVLKFKQSNWLQKYIDLNTDLRKGARNLFEKNFYKLMNNAVYGKTMENVDKRKDVKIVTTWESKRGRHLGARALISKPNFHSIAQFGSSICAIQLDRVKVTYDKPIYIGFTVLELSKYKMYDFHYDYMIPKYGQNLTLNYMDTDSFIYTIRTEDFYDDIREDVEESDSTKLRFDTSDYAHDNPYKLPLKNKKVIGLMKDENSGKIMLEFVGLRSKMYSLKLEDGNETLKAKGVKRIVLDNLDLRKYTQCLYNNQKIYGNMYIFRSKLHCLYTQSINKLALSNTDDKRYICRDKISTLAWGHYKIDSIVD